MHRPVEVRWIVNWIGGALASPVDDDVVDEAA